MLLFISRIFHFSEKITNNASLMFFFDENAPVVVCKLVFQMSIKRWLDFQKQQSDSFMI
jgi:hypothetical protein